MVDMHPPKTSKTFGEYSYSEVMSSILKSQATRIDLVFDEYKVDSLKKDERDRRGNDSSKYIVKEDTPMARDFNKFLKDDQNKSKLFKLIAKDFSGRQIPNKILVSTDWLSAMSSSGVSIENISPCDKEEADTRIFCHVADIAKNFKKVKIITVDSDVVVIALSVFNNLDLEELWVEFGSSKSRRWIPIHIYANLLGLEKCKALPFWFAFTGCDTTSQFAGHGKKSAWKTWTSFPECTDVFIR